MSQSEFEHQPDAEVTFELKNRAPNFLSEFVDPIELSQRLEAFRHGWTPEELAYLAGLQNQDGNAQFSEEYLNYLANSPLPEVHVSLNERGDIATFGTRRRFSYGWHKHVVERVAKELPDNFIGTSNIYLAHTLGLPPIGTYAHELPMVYAAIAETAGRNPLEGHEEMLEDWQKTYRGDLSTALTDTFTSEFFFADFTKEQAEMWKGLRHDSGDPIEFGEQVIAFYEHLAINPHEKTIVFSDGLDLDTIILLADHFKDRINIVFGWGTTLTNDLGVKTNNIVMKAVKVNGRNTVKLSDNIGKHTGDDETIERYQGYVNERTAQGHSAMGTPWRIC